MHKFASNFDSFWQKYLIKHKTKFSGFIFSQNYEAVNLKQNELKMIFWLNFDLASQL